MRVSVITVCYNSAKTLERCLSSVVAQDYDDIEHIVIDGGSSDESAEIFSKYQSVLSHLVSEPDDGIYDAMNKGLEIAKGDIICFLNSDDYYTSQNILSRVVKIMNEKALDALAGDVGFFRKNNPTRVVRRFRSNRFKPARLEWGWMPAHPALFLRTDVVNRVGKFKIDFKIAGDFDFIIRAFYGHDLRYEHIPEIFVNMQLGGASTGSVKSKVLLNQEVLRACRENGLKTNIFKILSKYPFKIMELIK